MPYDDDPLAYHAPDASRALSIPVQWSDIGVGTKVGLDYELKSGFLLGADFNILWIKTFGHSSFNSPLCFLSLKLGWNHNAIFCDDAIA